MTASITHTFVSPVLDLGNPNEVGPNEWNDTHTIAGEGLTGVNDTNVTLSFDAGAVGAVLTATSVTVGWTGTLALSRLAQGTNGQIIVGQTSSAPLYKTLSGDATLSSAGALTLASTVTAGGPTGSATVAPIITYDAKGRLTAVSSATVTPAVGSVTGLGTGVATALAVNTGSAGAFVVNTNGSTREVLSAARTYYVRTDGSDSNNGLADTAGGAFLTVQKAINVVSALDILTYTVTIQVRTGTFAQAAIAGPWVGTGTVVLQGDTSTPANCVLSVTSANAVQVLNGGRLTIKGFKLTVATVGSGLYASNYSTISFDKMDFGACASDHIEAADGGFISATLSSTYTISGGAAGHWHAHGAGAHIAAAFNTITLTGTPAFSTYFAGAAGSALIECQSDTFSGSATGPRYLIHYNAIVLTLAGTPSTYLPGNSAGTADGATGGYIA